MSPAPAFHSYQLTTARIYLKFPFFEVDVTTKFPGLVMFIFYNNFLNISMIFNYLLFDDFDSMLLSCLNYIFFII